LAKSAIRNCLCLPPLSFHLFSGILLISSFSVVATGHCLTRAALLYGRLYYASMGMGMSCQVFSLSNTLMELIITWPV
jgi:hypothetical protein